MILNYMKKIYYLLLLVLPAMCLLSCSHSVSYAEMKKQERHHISKWISDHNIKVITESEFYAQDTLTDVSKNEYVLFDETGVYMQIVNKAAGTRVNDGGTQKVLCRYLECDVESGDTVTTNMFSTSIVDAMMVSNNSGTYTAYFTDGYMNSYYGSSVPNGWLAPLPYIYLNRELDNIAKVKLIVPHSEGTSTASSGVIPFYYEISYQLGR